MLTGVNAGKRMESEAKKFLASAGKPAGGRQNSRGFRTGFGTY